MTSSGGRAGNMNMDLNVRFELFLSLYVWPNFYVRNFGRDVVETMFGVCNTPVS